MKLCPSCFCVTEFNAIAHVEPNPHKCAKCVASGETYETRQARMEAAFALVKPAANWKNPIRATVSVASETELDVIGDAIAYFTGSRAEFRRLKTTDSKGRARYAVRAPGYYVSIGA